MSRTSVDDVPIPWSHTAELAGLQQGLGPDLFHFHAQIFLTIPFGERLIFVEAGRPGSFALS